MHVFQRTTDGCPNPDNIIDWQAALALIYQSLLRLPQDFLDKERA